MADGDYSIIRNAIRNKQQVIATYEGHYREMCPHIIGKKEGRGVAVFYQFGGTSRSGLGSDGSEDNWRDMEIGKLSGVSVREGPWHTAKNYDPDKKKEFVHDIDLKV